MADLGESAEPGEGRIVGNGREPELGPLRLALGSRDEDRFDGVEVAHPDQPLPVLDEQPRPRVDDQLLRGVELLRKGSNRSGTAPAGSYPARPPGPRPDRVPDLAQGYAVQGPNGLLITPYDPTFEKAMAAYRRGAKKYRNALRELAK